MNKLCYFKSFNEANNSHEETPEEFWKDKNYMFSLVLPDDEGMYKLTFGINGRSFLLEQPNGDRLIGTIEDVLNNVDELVQLSPSLGLRDWILHNHMEMFKSKEGPELTEHSEIKDELKYVDLQVNGRKYTLGYEPGSGEGLLMIPLRVVDFKISSLYIDIPELPLIDDGVANIEIRRALVELGAKLPKTPYEVGYSISNNETKK